MMTKEGMTTQRNLFKEKITEEDRFRDFLKGIFHSCSHIYSFKILEEIFQEFTFELEAERLMEREAEIEEDIEEDDDF